MNITWDEESYENNFSFVHHYGQEVLELLDVPSPARVLDLGCGNGALAQALHERGYEVVGLDDSAEMLVAAKEAFPHLSFVQGNALDLAFEEPFDAVFSNAVLHWIDEEDQPQLIRSVARSIKSGGQFVFECGGYGNARLIHGALAKSFAVRGFNYQVPQYFQTIGQYASLLEMSGFKVVFARLFDRFTPLRGDDGVADWIRTFQQKAFEGMSEAECEEIIREVADVTKPELYVDGTWYADYVRLRMKAIKVDE